MGILAPGEEDVRGAKGTKSSDLDFCSAVARGSFRTAYWISKRPSTHFGAPGRTPESRDGGASIRSTRAGCAAKRMDHRLATGTRPRQGRGHLTAPPLALPTGSLLQRAKSPRECVGIHSEELEPRTLSVNRHFQSAIFNLSGYDSLYFQNLSQLTKLNLLVQVYKLLVCDYVLKVVKIVKSKYSVRSLK